MSSLRMRIGGAYQWLVDLLWRSAPAGMIASVLAFFIGSQIVRPHHRIIKAAVMGFAVLMVIRLEMIYSLYFFVILFPFPAGIVGTSTNIVLMTAVTVTWIFRAASQGIQVFRRTEVDWLILLFTFAYLLSLWNVETSDAFNKGLMIIWRHFTVIAFFYLIVRFADDEEKLERLTKVIAISAGLLLLTGLMELFMPGKTIIPGWISFAQPGGYGKLGFRLEGMRVGGHTGSQVLFADYSSLIIFLVGLHLLRAKNPAEKAFWFIWLALVVSVNLATANRGATVSLAIGVVYSFYVFRHSVNIAKYATAVVGLVSLAAFVHFLLGEYTVAVSLVDRLLGSVDEKFTGLVPESREGAWDIAFKHSMDHIFIGHGPYYGVRRGLEYFQWAHNGFVYYLYTIGLVGMGAFAMIVYRLARITFRYSRPAVRGKYPGMLMGVLHIQLLMFLIESQRTDHQRDGEFIYIYIVWMLFGLIAATGRLIDKAEAEERAELAAAPDAVPPAP